MIAPSRDVIMPLSKACDVVACASAAAGNMMPPNKA
jgi:hypothetical protein